VLNILWVVFGIGLMLVLTMTAGSDTFPTLAMPLRLLWPVSKRHVENLGTAGAGQLRGWADYCVDY